MSEWRQIADIADTNPETLGAGTEPDYLFKYIDLSSVGEGHVRWDGLQEFRFVEAPSRARRKVQSGDVLFGTVRPNLRSHGYVSEQQSGELVASTGFSVIRAIDGVSDGKYLFFAVLGEDIYAQSVNSAVGSNYPAVNDRDVRKFRVFAPPIREQAKIAQILDTLDTQIRQTEALIAKLERIKQGLLTDLLTRGIDENGQLRPTPDLAPHLYKDSPLGRIPKEWKVGLLDDFAQRGSGHTPSKSIPAYWNGGIKWVSLADSGKLDQVYIYETDKEISEQGIANSSATKHSPGTVILSRDAGIGKSAILASEMAVSQHFMAWRCGPTMHNLFLYYWLQWMKPRFEAIALGSTIQTIGLSYFKRLMISAPPKHEQELIAERLIQLQELIWETDLSLTKLKYQKEGLMDDLLTGRVRVTPLLDAAKQAIA